MSTNLQPEHPFSSTTFAWRYVKIARPPEANSKRDAVATFWHRLPKRNPRTPISITIKARGGPEAWVEVHARGSVGRYPGSTQICDIVNDINNCH